MKKIVIIILTLITVFVAYVLLSFKCVFGSVERGMKLLYLYAKAHPEASAKECAEAMIQHTKLDPVAQNVEYLLWTIMAYKL